MATTHEKFAVMFLDPKLKVTTQLLIKMNKNSMLGFNCIINSEKINLNFLTYYLSSNGVVCLSLMYYFFNL